MIVCRQCGHNNPDGTAWCQKCNSFLEFEGEAQPGQSGHTEQMAAVPPKPPGTTPHGDAGPPTVASAPVNRGESLVARPGDSPPTPDPSTAPRQPGEPEPADATATLPPTTAPASDIPPIRPGEIVCPVCGWGNEPSRRFCRHDGAVLTAPGAPRGQAEPLKAGQRRRKSGRGGRGPLIVVALLVPVLVAAAVLGVIYLWPDGDGGNGDGGASPKPTAAKVVVVPAGEVKVKKFSSQSGGRQATNLLDDDRDTFWSTAFPSGIAKNPRPDIDRRPRLEFSFDPAVTLTRIQVLNGAAGPEFGKRSRAKRIILQFPDGTEQIVELDDQGTEFQTIELKEPEKVSSVVLHISTSYQEGTAGGNRFRFSLNEVRFFKQA